MNVVERLRDLVSIDSVSSHSNRPMIERVLPHLASLPGRVQLHAWQDELGIEKLNLLYHLGPDGPPALALVAHSDVVPYDPAWSSALNLTATEGRLYGRGSADTKGGLAAMLEALVSIDLSRLRHPLVLIATADEEVGCKGARRLMDDRVVQPRHAVIAEPTRLIPVRGHKGYCADDIEVIGQEAHSAYPHLGDSAILAAGRLLVSISELAHELRSWTDAQFDPPYTSLNVGTIQGGKARNVIAGHCRFPLEWRPLPDQPLDHVHQLLQARVDKLQVKAELRNIRRDAGVLTPRDGPLVRCLEEQTGHAAETVAFGTEMPYLTALGAETCVLGPGDIREAHRTGEFVPQAELEQAVDIYRKVIEQFCF